MSDEDEFEGYDFSEFTDSDLAQIDANLARAYAGPALKMTLQDSPFTKFLSWKKHLAVTDLVSPLWCEVQHEYSLYGRRHRPLHLRPSTFTSRNGKKIHVHPQVAQANDQRLKHGKSVHKALEVELRPDKLVVRPVSEEERFGLRLLQLIDGFSQLVSSGITRELPVFTITHAQVVLGVIDEVLLGQANQDQADLPRSLTTPYSPLKKKQRMARSPTKHQVTSTVSRLSTRTSTTSMASETEPIDQSTETATPDIYELRILDHKTRRSSSIPLDEDSLSPRIQLMMYHRMLSTLLEPGSFDFDLLWSRLNLNPTKPFSAQFLNDIIWEQRQLDHTDGNVNLSRLVSEWISTAQRKPPGFVGVSRQLQIVYRRSASAGKQGKNEKHKVAETVDVDNPLEALMLQEELDIARAVEESLSGMGRQQAGEVAHHVAQNVTQVGPSSAVREDLVSPLEFGVADETCAQVTANRLQQADTDYGGNPCSEKSKSTLISVTSDSRLFDETKPAVTASEDQVQDGSTVEISPIIGTKEFEMDDDELDARLADVLRWWFGARPARGVDISQTNRCFTCEYQDSCEWREQKAREATTLASEREADLG